MYISSAYAGLRFTRLLYLAVIDKICYVGERGNNFPLPMINEHIFFKLRVIYMNHDLGTPIMRIGYAQRIKRHRDLIQRAFTEHFNRAELMGRRRCGKNLCHGNRSVKTFFCLNITILIDHQFPYAFHFACGRDSRKIGLHALCSQ